MDSTSPEPSPLEAVPLEVFEEICTHLTADKDPPSKRALAALASTSKRLLSATSPLQFHTIKIRFTSKSGEQIPHEVAQWRGVFGARGCSQYVRHLRIVEIEVPTDWDEIYGRSWPPDREESQHGHLFGPVGGEVWPLDKDDEFWTIPVAVPFEPWAETPTAAERLQEQQLWAPVVDLISSLRGLTDVEYQCHDQIPPTLVTALNERDGDPPLRLHMYGFSLRCQYQDEANLHDIDEDEYRLATSPCLSSIRLVVPSTRYNYRALVRDGRTCYYEDAVASMVKGLAPNLKSVSVSTTPPGLTGLEDTLWPGFFPSQPADKNTPPRGKGALETLALGHRVRADPKSIRAWADRTDFSVLRSLHLRTRTNNATTLSALGEIAESGGLRSLRSLSLWTWVDWGMVDENGIGDPGDAELARFLQALPPLCSLELKGPFLGQAFSAVLSCHGPSLRKLRLAPLRDHDIQPTPFVLTRQRVKDLVRSCPNVEDLELLVPRTGGDEKEASIYRALAELPALDRLSLILDCSDLGALGGVPGGPLYGEGDSRGIPHEAIHNSIVNLNTSSLALAQDIFDALCLHRSPRLIRLLPDEIGNMGMDDRDQFIITIADLLSRAWIRRRDDRAGREGECTITEVVPRNMEHSKRQPLRPDFHHALEEIWPDAERWPGDMVKRVSYPLWKPR